VPKIIKKAVAISDLHLGQKESILNPRFFPRSNLEKLAEQIDSLGKVDELIIVGDFMDFSLTSLREAYQNARDFFGIIGKLHSVEEIVYLPGNHDHHLWLELVENEEVIEKVKQGHIPLPMDQYVDRLVDRSFGDKSNEIFLDSLLPQRNDGTKMKLKVKYPHHFRSFGKEKRYYLFTHGHYLEDLFKPVDVLLEPGFLAELEAFNCLWLEGLWYHMGQSGRFGQLIESIFNDLIKGKTEIASSLIANIVNLIEKKYQVFWLKIPFVKKLANGYLRKKLKAIGLKKRADLAGSPIDNKQKLRIQGYIEKFVLNRYHPIQNRKQIPTPFTFVYGHTHRYFEGETLSINGQTYDLVNTGGWLEGETKDNAGMLVIEKEEHSWISFFHG